MYSPHPKYQLLPPLSQVERDGLKSLIVQNGPMVPLETDEENNIIDGHHRLEIYNELGLAAYPTIARKFNSEIEKLAYVYKINEGRRQLSSGQKSDILKAKKILAGQLKETHSQEKVGEMLGVARRTISDWLNGHDKNTAIGGSANSGIDNHLYEDKSLDSRTKISPKTKQGVLEAANEGKTQERIAAEFKLSQQAVSRIIAAARKNESKRTEAATQIEGRAIVELATATQWLDRQGQCDLLLTDPPYSTDVANIEVFAREWLPAALSHLKSTGRAYIFIGAYPIELLAYLSVNLPTQVLVWEYKNTLGPHPAKNYKQNWQAILYYCMPEAAPLNGDKLTEKFSVQNFNAPDARHEEKYNVWEKPIELAELIIKQATQPGATIFDPYAGTGTFLLAAAINKRIGLGCDNSETMIEICKKRGIEYVA